MVNDKVGDILDDSTLSKQEENISDDSDFLKVHNKRNDYLNIEKKPDDWVVEAKGSIEL